MIHSGGAKGLLEVAALIMALWSRVYAKGAYGDAGDKE
jgi:hypothetical protein